MSTFRTFIIDDESAPASSVSAFSTAVSVIHDSVIGNNSEGVPGPFGSRSLMYLDYTASGRSLTLIEDYIRDEVLPLYANTHTSSSATGLQTSLYRNEAR